MRSNNIDIFELAKKNMFVVYAVSAALAALVIYLVFFAPFLKQLRLKYTECRACENLLSEVSSTIAYASGLNKVYGSRVLISEKEAAAAIDELTAFSKSLGINFVEMKPHDIIYKEGALYKILPLEMDIEANGEQFVKFMSLIDELKKAIIKVESFDIEPDKDDRTKLKIKMVADIYLSTK